MRWLQKLPNMPRSAPGLEWQLWRRLPWIWAAGNGAVLLLWLVLHLGLPAETAAHLRQLQLWDYMLLGVVALWWSAIVTLGFGCVVVMLMKGPGYVADGLEVSHSDRPRSDGSPVKSPTSCNKDFFP